MNQEKIGKYIAEKRKEKKLTQQKLAERLGVTDRTISNWENGKNMPDLSLFKPLCHELDISINELMNGEKIDEDKYINVLEENIVNMVSNLETKRKRKIKITIIIILVILFLFIMRHCIYDNWEITLKYDSRAMICEIKDQKLKFINKGQSTLNIYHTIRKIGDEQVYFFNSTVNLYNKRRSNWEYSQSMLYLLDGKDTPFGTIVTYDVINDNIKAYYTDISIKKINNASEEELEEIISKSYLMCSS